MKTAATNITTRHYRGRLAPSPSGKMHLGHIQTFWIAQQRAISHNGTLVLRVEDIDLARCKPHFLLDIITDLNWAEIEWDLGPGCKPFNLKTCNEEDLGPFEQSQRGKYYLNAWKKLYDSGYIYPSPHSRRDVERAVSAPHEGDAEVIFPVSLRCNSNDIPKGLTVPNGVNWRFRVPDGSVITFKDNRCGFKEYKTGVDFGDFVIWRGTDNTPSYELAVVVDDNAMQITEVVRGEDLLLSTARQLLLYEALELDPPEFFHCPIVRDKNTGTRIAKRDSKYVVTDDMRLGQGQPTASSTVEMIRAAGWTASQMRQELFQINVNDTSILL